MAYSLTYNGLIADALELLEDESPEVMAQMDAFIARAELTVQRDLDLECLKNEAALANTTAGTREVARGSDLITIDSLWLTASGSKVLLEKRTYDYCVLYAPASATQAQPVLWAEKNPTSIYVVPTPSDTFVLTAYGVERPDGLSEDTATTWLSTNCGDLLLDQVMILAETYLGHDAAVARYQGLYTKHLASSQIELRGLSRSAYLMLRKAASATRVA